MDYIVGGKSICVLWCEKTNCKGLVEGDVIATDYKGSSKKDKSRRY